MNIIHLNSIEITTLSLFAIVYLWQLTFLIRRIKPVANYIPANSVPSDFPPVSVIICARNEAQNLEDFLPAILSQDYPDYQVIVVNDGSEDETDLLLARFKARYPHLYYTSIAPDKKFHHGKKLPLSLGIKAAKHENMVFTDADCRPASDQWLKKMVTPLILGGKELILGIGSYKKTKGLTNLWIRYDTFTIAIQYLGYALSGKPYMGTGRNLAYTKTLFTKNNGFKNHIYIASGDDDLFVQEAATSINTGICIDKDAHTISIPPKSFKKWNEQKQRHLSTSSRYRINVKLPLILEPLTREIFWGLSCYFIFFPNFVLFILPFSLLLLSFKLILWKKASDKTGLGKTYWGVLLFDFIQPFIIGLNHLGNLKGSKKRKWK